MTIRRSPDETVLSVKKGKYQRYRLLDLDLLLPRDARPRLWLACGVSLGKGKAVVIM